MSYCLDMATGIPPVANKRERGMNKMEQAAQNHLREYWEMVRSGEWDRLERADRAKRLAANKKLGHSPKCGILKCHPDCKAGR